MDARIERIKLITSILFILWGFRLVFVYAAYIDSVGMVILAALINSSDYGKK
jgi:hypothetical protein